MADTKISALTAQTGAAVAAGDLFPTVDVSDTTMAVTGTNKKITYAELLNALGTVYQPLDSDLTAIAALTTTAFGRGLLALADAAALRTSAGLDADLGTFSVPASTTISAYGATLVDDADASTARTTLGLGSAATTASTAYATAAQGATADTALQPATIGVTVQGYDADLADLAAIADVQGDIIVRGASGWERLAKSATSTHVLTAGASQPQWAAPSAGGSTLPASRNLTASGGYAVAGYGLPGVVFSGTASNFISTAGRIYYSPCIWNVNSVITDVAMVVTSGYAATVGRIGLYTCDEQWTPSTLVADFGTIDHTSGGTKTITGLSQAVSGMTRYALAYMADGQFRCTISYGGCVHGGPGQAPLGPWDDWSAAQTYGTMPSTATTPDRWPGYRLATIGSMKWTTA